MQTGVNASVIVLKPSLISRFVLNFMLMHPNNFAPETVKTKWIDISAPDGGLAVNKITRGINDTETPTRTGT